MGETSATRENGAFMDRELKALRDELVALKNCQITFIKFAVGATGAILTAAGILLGLHDRSAAGILSLLPLVIVIPAWWIFFFDKATTITRAVAYYRIVESLALGLCRDCSYIGWENALREFRDKGYCRESSRDKKSAFRISQLARLFLLIEHSRYWPICYYTFLTSSLLSLWLSMYVSQQAWHPMMIIAGVVVLITVIWNGRLLWQLSYGIHSYNTNERIWKRVLEFEEK